MTEFLKSDFLVSSSFLSFFVVRVALVRNLLKHGRADASGWQHCPLLSKLLHETLDLFLAELLFEEAERQLELLLRDDAVVIGVEQLELVAWWNERAGSTSESVRKSVSASEQLRE